MSPDDLDGDLNPGDVEIIEDFENAWHAFLINNAGVLPRGKRGVRSEEIQRQIDELTRNKNNVESELKRQLDFFGSSKERLETSYKQAMTNAATAQKKIHADLKILLDNVAIADSNLNKCIPWGNFFEALEAAIGQSEDRYSAAENTHPSDRSMPPVTPNGSKTIRPSDRAMFFVDDSVGDEKDIQLRAYRVDHALLSAQIKSLQKEVECYEKTTDSLEAIGKFLTEHNIWSILS